MQKWYLLKLTGKDSDVNLNASGHAEFDDWKWTSLKSTTAMIIGFKKNVYERVVSQFSYLEKEVDHNLHN